MTGQLDAAERLSIDEGPPLSARVRTVKELLSLDPGITVPDYQRPYRWTPRNIGQLVDDIQEFQTGGRYRVGTVILHSNGGDPEIVDGQQRFISFVLLALALRHALLGKKRTEAVTSALADLDGLDLEAVGASPYGLKVTHENVARNFDYLTQIVAAWSTDALVAFTGSFLDECEVAVVEVENLDAAFQMFDSQNTRGRALYPTDLLKAFHIREMSAEHVSAETRMSMVRLWESIPPAHINRLFSDYLFHIKRWAGGHSVPERGFTEVHIGLFKGIQESRATNLHAGWVRPFIYAKNFTDDFRQENATLVRFGAMVPVEYPHQIDQPVLNGETFFQMVAHYCRLAEGLGLFADGNGDVLTGTAWHNAVGWISGVDPGDSRLVRVRNLFECLVLYYVDRFGTLDPATSLTFARFATTVRIWFSTLRHQSVDNFALGSDARNGFAATNMFREIRECTDPIEFTRRTIAAPPAVAEGERVANVRIALRENLWSSTSTGEHS